MATTDYLSSADLAGVAKGGAINEDVMAQIWDISRIPLPFTDLVGQSTHDNANCTWLEDALAAASTSNAKIDGQDITSFDSTAPAARVGNHSQISTKAVAVTNRAQNVNAIGGNALAYQLMQRQQELKRDIEATCLYNQASLADNGNNVAGLSGGLPSWIATAYSVGAGAGAIGGYSTSTGYTVAYTPGTSAAGSEATLRTLLQTIYTNGGNSSVLMSTPGVIRKFSEYLFSSTAKVATLMSDKGQTASAATAIGSVNVFVTDFNVVVEFVANRLQPVISSTNHTLFALDPQYLEISYLQGVNVEPLAKAGLADKRLMSADWTLKVLNEKAQGMYADINPTSAWVA